LLQTVADPDSLEEELRELRIPSPPNPGALRVASSPSGFANTRWSLVAALRADVDGGHKPLLELCLHNWYPVYSYLRRCGHAPHEARSARANSSTTFCAKARHVQAPASTGGSASSWWPSCTNSSRASGRRCQ
jgi:hypothetical protein